jgi:hypothetical protein
MSSSDADDINIFLYEEDQMVGSGEIDTSDPIPWEAIDEADLLEERFRLRLHKRKVLNCKPTNNRKGCAVQILVLRCSESKDGQACRTHFNKTPQRLLYVDLKCPHCCDGLIRYDTNAEKVCDSCKTVYKIHRTPATRKPVENIPTGTFETWRGDHNPADWRKGIQNNTPGVDWSPTMGSKPTPGGDLYSFGGDIMMGKEPSYWKKKKSVVGDTDNRYKSNNDKYKSNNDKYKSNNDKYKSNNGNKYKFVPMGRVYNKWRGVEIAQSFHNPECFRAMMEIFNFSKYKSFRRLCRIMDEHEERALTRRRPGRPKVKKDGLELLGNHGLKGFRALCKACEEREAERKPRGRPRKTPAPEPTVRRPRGRPRKEQLIDLTTPPIPVGVAAC